MCFVSSFDGSMVYKHVIWGGRVSCLWLCPQFMVTIHKLAVHCVSVYDHVKIPATHGT